jgi:hypothetical protein
MWSITAKGERDGCGVSEAQTLNAKRVGGLTEHDEESDDEGPGESDGDPCDLKAELSEVAVQPACKRERRVRRATRKREEDNGLTSRDGGVGIVVGDGGLSEDTGEKRSDNSREGVTWKRAWEEHQKTKLVRGKVTSWTHKRRYREDHQLA